MREMANVWELNLEAMQADLEKLSESGDAKELFQIGVLRIAVLP